MNSRVRRMRLLTAVSMLGLAGSVLAVLATPVSASPTAEVSTSPSFQIKNLSSGLCLGVYMGHHDAPALQWGCNGNPDQSWHWNKPDFPGSAFEQLVNGDGQCLGVAGGSDGLGAQVVGWDCLGPSHDDQYWWPEDGSAAGPCGPYYSDLVNANSGYVLGVGGNPAAQGSPAVQWSWQGICNNQMWKGPLLNYP